MAPLPVSLHSLRSLIFLAAVLLMSLSTGQASLSKCPSEFEGPATCDFDEGQCSHLYGFFKTQKRKFGMIEGDWKPSDRTDTKGGYIIARSLFPIMHDIPNDVRSLCLSFRYATTSRHPIPVKIQLYIGQTMKTYELESFTASTAGAWQPYSSQLCLEEGRNRKLFISVNTRFIKYTVGFDYIHFDESQQKCERKILTPQEPKAITASTTKSTPATTPKVGTTQRTTIEKARVKTTTKELMTRQLTATKESRTSQPMAIKSTTVETTIIETSKETLTEGSTAEPSTVELITVETTTAEQTREEPKTEEPKTVEQTTEEPKTEERTTVEQTREEPKTEEPTTVEQTREEPKTEEPTTVEQTTEEPKTEEPTTVEQTTEEPTTIEPTTEDPTTEELRIVLATTEAQTSEETTLVVSPTSEPSTAEPTTVEPTTEKPTTLQPAKLKPRTTQLSTTPVWIKKQNSSECSSEFTGPPSCSFDDADCRDFHSGDFERTRGTFGVIEEDWKPPGRIETQGGYIIARQPGRLIHNIPDDVGSVCLRFRYATTSQLSQTVKLQLLMEQGSNIISLDSFTVATSGKWEPYASHFCLRNGRDRKLAILVETVTPEDTIAFDYIDINQSPGKCKIKSSTQQETTKPLTMIKTTTPAKQISLERCSSKVDSVVACNFDKTKICKHIGAGKDFRLTTGSTGAIQGGWNPSGKSGSTGGYLVTTGNRAKPRAILQLDVRPCSKSASISFYYATSSTHKNTMNFKLNIQKSQEIKTKIMKSATVSTNGQWKRYFSEFCLMHGNGRKFIIEVQSVKKDYRYHVGIDDIKFVQSATDCKNND